MAVGDIYRATIGGYLQDQFCECTFKYRALTNDVEPDMLDYILNHMRDVVAPALAAVQSKDFSWSFTTTSRMRPLPAGAPRNDFYIVLGTVEENALPSEVAAVLKRGTQLGGQRNRGRIYLPGAPKSGYSNVDGFWTEAYFNNLKTAALVLRKQVQVGMIPKLDPVIFHYDNDTTQSITTTDANSAPRSQRRRQIGRGI